MKRIILAFYALGVSLSLAGQKTNLDSLLQLWNDHSQPDTVRLQAVNKLSWDGYIFSKPDSTAFWSLAMYEFAKEKGLPKYMADAQHIQGSAQFMMGNYERAIEYYNTSLSIREKIDDKKGVAGSLNNLGIIYQNNGDYSKALAIYLKALNIQEQLGHKKGIASVLNNIGNIYNKQGANYKSIDYHARSLKISEETGDQQGIAGSLGNIGIIYSDLGEYENAISYCSQSFDIKEAIGDKNGMTTSLLNIGGSYKSLGNLDKALEYYDRGLKLSLAAEDKESAASLMVNIGNVYKDQGKYAKALEYLTNSLEVFKEVGSQEKIAIALNNIGGVYTELQDHKKALDYFERAHSIAIELGSVETIATTTKSLWESYKRFGNQEASLQMYELYIESRDSLKSEENQRATVQREFEYEYEKQSLADSLAYSKKEAIQDLEIEKRDANLAKQQIGLAAAGCGLLLLGLLAYSIRRGKKRSDELLHNILPKEVASELKQKGYSDARQFDETTVLFTDFKGFTAMSEKLSPKELVNDLNLCFSEFDKMTGKYGIEKIKTIGDSYMAAGGIPAPSADHARNMVLAALEMASFVEEGKQRKIAQNLPYFEIRIGIHTGPVVAGIVGVKKFQYDIWGDTVNTASRMESSGEVGKVNISQETYKLLQDDPDFTFESRGKIEAKGKGEMEMYFVARQ